MVLKSGMFSLLVALSIFQSVCSAPGKCFLFLLIHFPFLAEFVSVFLLFAIDFRWDVFTCSSCACCTL